MLKLINVGVYNGTNKKSVSEFIQDIVNAINNNSSVFTAEVDSTNAHRFNITSDNISIINTGVATTNISNAPECGLTVAIDDDKEFLIILNRIILNTQTAYPQNQSDGILPSYSGTFPIFTMMCATGKDISGNNFTVHGVPNVNYYQGLSCWLDIGQHGTDDYTSEGDFILRQGAIRNHIVPELFFSMTRLGACGDIIEKDGHQYTCIAGPIFYQIS